MRSYLQREKYKHLVLNFIRTNEFDIYNDNLNRNFTFIWIRIIIYLIFTGIIREDPSPTLLTNTKLINQLSEQNAPQFTFIALQITETRPQRLQINNIGQ